MGAKRRILGACLLVVICALTFYRLSVYHEVSSCKARHKLRAETVWGPETLETPEKRNLSDVLTAASYKPVFRANGRASPTNLVHSLRDEGDDGVRPGGGNMNQDRPGHEVETANKNDRLAYFTVADDTMGVYTAKVLEYQLKERLHSPYQLHALLPDTPEGRKLGPLCKSLHLQHTFAKPVQSTNRLNGTSHQSLKLRLFTFTEYKRIVYLDSDIYILKSVDQLFQHTGIVSGVYDIGADGHNSGVMTITPNKALAARVSSHNLISHSGGNQDFFHMVVKPHEWSRLPSEYNVLWRTHRHHGAWRSFFGKFRILHMSSAIKPWNFYTVPNTLSAFHLGTALLYMRDAYTALGAKGSSFGWQPACAQPLRDVYGNGRYSRASFNHTTDKFTVVITACKRLDSLIDLVQRYSELDIVHKVIVVLKPCGLTVPASFAEMPKVQVQQQIESNVVARFTLDPVETEAVLICNDNVFVTPRDIAGAFNAWKSHRDQIVGLYERDVVYDDATQQYKYITPSRYRMEPYSIILAKFMFVRTEYLHMYRCLMPRRLLFYVKKMFNCEDVSFSMMVSGFTGLPPVRYQPIDRVVDKDSLDNNATSRRTLKAVGRSPASHPPPTGGRKNSAMHLPKRDHCVNTFKQEYFFYNRVYSNLAVTNWP